VDGAQRNFIFSITLGDPTQTDPLRIPDLD
jgi:hypothetical protein